MYKNFDYRYIIISLILMAIIIGHVMWFYDENTKMMKMVVIMSVVLFVMIFAKHALYVKRKEKEEKNMTYDIYKYKNMGYNNKALNLIRSIMDHPIIFMW